MKAEYIDHMGSDLTVVNSARVSFDNSSEWLEGQDIFHTDKGYMRWRPESQDAVLIDSRDAIRVLLYRDFKLISYLARNGHWTPFAHPQITMRETVPIFVARQRFKHMVGFAYNEVSRRYVDDEPEIYYPADWRSRPDGSVKQGSGTRHVTEMLLRTPIEVYETKVDNAYDIAMQQCLDLYGDMIEAGIAPEQARMVLPQSMYTSYYVTGSLAAWARAYKQRSDSHAQVEIQELAEQWNSVIAPLFPVSWAELT